MSDVHGAAPAAADSPSMPEAVIGEGANFTQPLGSQVPPDAQTEPKGPPSLDDSIDRAIEKSAKATKEAPAKVEAKPEPKEAKVEQPRDNGKFAKADDKTPAIDSQPVKDAPSVAAPKPAGGLSPAGEDAPKWIKPHEKAAWSTMAPEQRAIAERRDKEAAALHEKYGQAAERDSTLTEYHDMAKQSGKDLRTVVGEYVNMETMLRNDLVGGLDTICQRLGVSLKDVAAHVMGQTPEQNASAQDATIRELKAELAAVKQQVGTVTQTFQRQKETAIYKEVEAFTEVHPRLNDDDFANDVAFFLETRCPGDLSEAYKLAERLNPAPAQQAPTTAASSAPVIDLASAQPDKGQKSINGAPSAGASPGKKRVALSLDDALDRAFGQAG